MTWFFAVLLVLLIGGIAVVLSGRVGDVAMSEEYDDRRDVRVQADGPLTAADLRAVRFNTVVRGYRASEVDALLDRLSAQLDRGTPPPARPFDADPVDVDARPPGEPRSPDGGAGLPDWSAPGSRRPVEPSELDM